MKRKYRVLDVYNEYIMISVLLSVYFKEDSAYLRQCFESIFSQTVLPDEIVLVKDGPLTSILEKVIAEYENKYSGKFKIIPLVKNQGLGKALNEGLKHCSYDIIARMDTDDIAKPNRFEKQIAILENYPEIDVVGSWIDEFEGETFNIKSVRILPEIHNEIRIFAQRRNPINHPVVMFRKKSVIEAGGYQHCPLFEDYHLWVRMLINGAKFYNIQESLLYFRFSPTMFRRRGGWKYAMDEFKFQLEIKKMGFISTSTFVFNVMIRFFTRIIPNGMRIRLYKTALRK